LINRYGLLGPSGCGKTSLLRCIVGTLKPNEGSIKIFGKTPGEPESKVPGSLIGYMPQELALFPDFTIEETLNYFGRLYHLKDSVILERTVFLLKFLDLPDKRRLVGNLSGGQKRRVSLAAALVHNPPLLILDEPTVGVDPLLRQSIWDYLVTLSKTERLTVIITTHYIEEARAANIVGLMRFGRILIEESPDYLLQQFNYPTLEEVFLKLCELDSNGVVISDYNREHNLKECKAISLTNSKPDICYEANTVKSIEPDTTSNTSSSSSGVGDSDDNIEAHTESIDSSLNKAETTFCDIPKNSTEKFEHHRNSFFDSAARTSALFWKNITRLRRNMAVLLFQFLLPSIEVILFCTCIGQHPFDITIAVYNQESSGQFSEWFLNTIDNKTIIQKPYHSFDSAIAAVKDGNAWAALVIGKNFSSAMQLR
jgi:ABC-type multidrug transport system ATPase subunit